MHPDLSARGYVLLPTALPLAAVRLARERLAAAPPAPEGCWRVHPFWVSHFPALGTFSDLLEEGRPSLRDRVEQALGTEVQVVGEQYSLRLPEWSAPGELVPHVDDGAGIQFRWILAVFLTGADRPWRGNLTLWTKNRTAPTQLMLQAGDAVLFLADLPHAAAPNLAGADHWQVREALYFRLQEQAAVPGRAQ